MMPLVTSFHAPASFLPGASSNLAATVRASCAQPALRVARMQMEAPERIKIPDTFNPAEWGSPGGGGLGSGGGGGLKIPDSFNPAELEREKDKANVAVLDRPT